MGREAPASASARRATGKLGERGFFSPKWWKGLGQPSRSQRLVSGSPVDSSGLVSHRLALSDSSPAPLDWSGLVLGPSFGEAVAESPILGFFEVRPKSLAP